MNAKQVHAIAVDVQDSLVESRYWNIFEQIDAAAKEGRFQIIVDEVEIQDDLISYLCKNEFRVEFHNQAQHTWYPCNVGTKIPWTFCDAIIIRW